MNKKTYLITGLVGLITLIGAGCTTEQTTKPPVNTVQQVVESQDVVAETVTPVVDQYYMAEKSGTTTVVYKDTYKTGAREEVFSFQEARTYEPGSRNTYGEMRPSIAYDRDNDLFAYTTTEGLFLYNNRTSETTAVISKTGSSGKEIDDIAIPTWSDAEITNVLFLVYPQFSADGKYLSFSGAFYEGIGSYIMHLETKKIVKLAGKDDHGITGYNVSWSPSGHNLVIGRGVGYGSSGLFSVTSEDFGNAAELLSMAAIEFTAVDGAVYVDTDTIGYTYNPDANDPKRLAIINTDGTESRVLVDDSVNNYVMAAHDQQIIYFKKDAYTPANDGLWIYNINDGSNRQAAAEEDGQDLVLQSFNGDALVYIAYDTTNHLVKLYSENSDTLEKTSSAVKMGQNVSVYFLGWE